MFENENIDFKREYTENIFKDIVAFLNTKGGIIYIGYDDNGELIGINESKSIEEKISNGISQKIEPDASVFISIISEKLENKDYIIIKISKGTNVYSLKNKGVLQGTYIRSGTCSIPTSQETIRQMLFKVNNITFETSISHNQDLTFDYVIPIFENKGIDINNKSIKVSLKLLDEEKRYTNLALLLSDQNPFTVKIGVYKSEDKAYFIDRREYSGSLFKIYDDVLEYLKLNSSTYGLIYKSEREDIEEYPEINLREILLNSLIHRDYSILNSNIINIYKDQYIEFLNHGTLYGDLTVEDALQGFSNTRNPNLQSIFFRLGVVEAIGSGLRRVNSYYKERNLNFEIKSLPTTFIAKVPRIEIDEEELKRKMNGSSNKNIGEKIILYGNDKDRILEYIKLNGFITRREAEKILGKEKTATIDLLNEMIDDGLIITVGSGRAIKYVLKK